MNCYCCCGTYYNWPKTQLDDCCRSLSNNLWNRSRLYVRRDQASESWVVDPRKPGEDVSEPKPKA